jgi:GH15 family glucan-1,4-alpha-glucosidase
VPHGFLSDSSTAALVTPGGTVEWWCVPRFDSPSVFGRLLGPDAGHWSLRPAAESTVERSYAGDSLVLRTVHTTVDGAVEVTDALAFAPGARGHDIGLDSPHTLIRRVTGLRGTVRMTTELAPRPEYGRTEPHWRPVTGGVEARGGPVRLVCRSTVDWTLRDSAAHAVFDVAAGERVELRLGAGRSFAPVAAHGDLDDTLAGWRSWAADHTTYDGPFAAEVRRSSVVLQGLTYAPSGAIVAAASTGLPETPGGDDAWDYRFAWLRDLSLTARALWLAACPAEPARLLDWVSTATGHLRDEPVQIVYGVGGERDLTERVLDHLPGPIRVRVGNDAYRQTQLDVLGEVLDAAALLGDDLELTPAVTDLLVAMADRAADTWPEADSGMWEARDARRHYTSSKVLCWVALDRAVTLAPRLGVDPGRWKAAAADVRAAVLEQAWSPRAGAYAGAFGSDELDASVLVLPLVGFLPVTDPRMAATIDAVATRLDAGGLVRRWAGDRGGFLICTYWLVECLAMAGRAAEAERLFRRATAHGDELGLLAEEADPDTGAPRGNVPQAFSHVGLVNAAWRLGNPGT